jgi:AraC-like DNA-binding protein
MNDHDILHEITPLSDKDCFYIVERSKTGFTFPLHKHFEYELNYIENAAGARRIVGDSVEVIGNYDLVLITGHEMEHVWENYHCTSQNIREITIQFSPEIFPESLLNKNPFKSIKLMLERAQKGLAFSTDTIIGIRPFINSLQLERQNFYSLIHFLSILYELSKSEKAYTLASNSYAPTESTIESRRVKKVHDYLMKHYTEEIRLSQISSLAGMSEASFSRFFKLRTGKSFTDYLIDIRIGSAIRRLVDSNQAISEICFGCGFNNISNFNRIFKKLKGCTPKEFRDNYHKTKTIV